MSAHFGSFILFGKKSKGTKTFSPLSFFLSLLFSLSYIINPVTLSSHYGLNDLDSTLDGDHLHLLSIRKSIHVGQQEGRWDEQGTLGTIAAVFTMALEWHGVL